MRRIVFALLFAGAHYAHAATVSVALSPNELPVVLIEGTLTRGDVAEFDAKVAAFSSAIVVFQSDGGEVLAGIMIGETIHEKKFATLVPAETRCASACAIAWLGGTPRFMGSKAQ